MSPLHSRRAALRLGAAGLPALTLAGRSIAAEPAKDKPPAVRGKPTQFQIACMTLPYSQFPLDRALSGLKAAGYQYVASGPTHKEYGGKSGHVPPPAPRPAHA